MHQTTGRLIINKTNKQMHNETAKISYRNKGGRPKKEQDLQNKHIRLRLNQAQFDKLEDLESQTGLSRTQLFIARVMDDQQYIISKELLVQLANWVGNGADWQEHQSTGQTCEYHY